MKLKTMYLLVLATAMLVVGAPLRASEADDRIESAFKQTYVYMMYLRDDGITTKATDGVVTLTGTVADEDQKTLAGETLASLPGVIRVDNQLTIKNETATAGNADERIARKVKQALLLHPSIAGAGNLSVHVKNGVATLRGAVPSTVQIDRATVYAQEIDGVTDVNNEMTVAERPETTEQENAVLDDASITAQIRIALLNHRSTSAIKVRVATNNGVVTLTGIAKNADEKDMATLFVSDIQGVTRVNNLMKVEAPMNE